MEALHETADDHERQFQLLIQRRERPCHLHPDPEDHMILKGLTVILAPYSLTF
jgi:hypothetical protein